MTNPAVSLPTFLPLLIAVAMRRAEQHIHADLVAAGALSADTAVALAYVQPLRRTRLRRLVASGAVRSASAGHFYLDEAAWATHRASRRRRALVALSIVLALAGVAVVAASVWSWRAD